MWERSLEWEKVYKQTVLLQYRASLADPHIAVVWISATSVPHHMHFYQIILLAPREVSFCFGGPPPGEGVGVLVKGKTLPGTAKHGIFFWKMPSEWLVLGGILSLKHPRRNLPPQSMNFPSLPEKSSGQMPTLVL